MEEKNKIIDPWEITSEVVYKENSISQRKKFLIICEGYTEEIYFDSFPDPKGRIDIEFFNLKGRAKSRLIQKIKNRVRSSKIKYDKIWCVFDRDYNEGTEEENKDFNEKISKGNKLEKCEMIYSNDAFELWFLLHYEDWKEPSLRSVYYEKLITQWQLRSEKDLKKKDFCKKRYEELLPYQVLAIERAKKLYAEHQHKDPHDQNPVTMVYRLVEELNNNVRPWDK